MISHAFFLLIIKNEYLSKIQNFNEEILNLGEKLKLIESEKFGLEHEKVN